VQLKTFLIKTLVCGAGMMGEFCVSGYFTFASALREWSSHPTYRAVPIWTSVGGKLLQTTKQLGDSQR